MSQVAEVLHVVGWGEAVEDDDRTGGYIGESMRRADWNNHIVARMGVSHRVPTVNCKTPLMMKVIVARYPVQMPRGAGYARRTTICIRADAIVVREPSQNAHPDWSKLDDVSGSGGGDVDDVTAGVLLHWVSL